MTCENCGTKLSDGMCPNCHEELFIEVWQGDDIDDRSEEWNQKVAEQAAEVASQQAKR